MTLAATLWHALPLALIAGVSPIMFVNAYRVTIQGGRDTGLRFAAGTALVLAPLGAAVMGLMGAAATEFASRQLASRTVDAVLGVLLVAYGVVQWRARRAHRRSPQVTPTRPHRSVVAGMLGMATNFTTLPIFVAIAQRLGTTTGPLWARIVALAVVVVVCCTPAWLPVAMKTLDPNRGEMKERTRARILAATSAVSIGACLIGGVLILWHAALG